MARKIRFPLKMANGADVRSLEEFIENFDLESALGYYEDGKLITWLRDRYHDTEADKLEALDKTAKSFTSDFCAVFGKEAAADDVENGADIDYIARRNEKKRILRTITDDESVIYNVDSVALDQDDLLDIFDEGKKEIYLCQGEFEIPLSVTGVTYHGIADPVVTVRVTDNVNFNEKNIKFVDCVYGWDVSKTSPLDNMKRAEHLFLKGDYQKSAGILETYAEQGNPRAVMLLCHIYKDLLPDTDKLKKWSEKAKQSCEVCNVIENIESSAEKYFALLKKFADRGDAFFEYYYALALNKYEQYHSDKENVKELIKFYHTQYKEIEKYFSLSADKGNVAAMSYVGLQSKAAEMGSVSAIKKMGSKYKYDRNDENARAKAIKWYTKAAELGDAEALYKLGELYDLARDPKDKDIETALMWYSKAAEKGHHWAQEYLFRKYYYGWGGTTKNPEEGIKWITKRADQGDRSSEFLLGCALYDQEDYESAVKWFKKSTDQGNLDSMIKLVDCYYYGYGVESDNNKAFEIVLRYAEQRDDRFFYPDAENILGNIYYKGFLTDTDYNEAVKWYKKAVNDGCIDALTNLAYCYYTGNGVSRNIKEACKLLMEAERQNSSYRTGKLNYAFDNILSDEDEIDYQEFFDLYKAEAEKGNADAQYILGDLWYYRGTNDDVDQDYIDAVEWYTKSANQGNSDAQYRLANCYAEGDGVDEDIEKGMEWLFKAAANGNENAIVDILGVFEDFIDDEDVEQIERFLPFVTKTAENNDDNGEKAQDCLGRLYSKGLGLEKNLDKAIMWFTKSHNMEAIRDIILSSDNTITN